MVAGSDLTRKLRLRTEMARRAGSALPVPRRLGRRTLVKRMLMDNVPSTLNVVMRRIALVRIIDRTGKAGVGRPRDTINGNPRTNREK